MDKKHLLLLLAVIQIGCALFFVSEIVLTIFGGRTAPISWRLRELLEIGAAVGLVLGTSFAFVALRTAQRQQAKAEESLRQVQSAFHEHLEERFEQWSLTNAERDVALFSLKGLSVSEIAAVRETSEGTVKAQSNAIYRKAGVSGRSQLLSLFIEDLIED
ncbi:helix-turn-helix transcriptional regulator [Cognatishimia activa]|uniref:helix-turn-helix transcriptional regulator n=1 Tax=Cognatishimia activa TaxID=1715691 RepID=UPI00222F1D1D|nr:LuxR C-terminal-related transcriptional regulator [Cognatishimia activa]UZD89611.1 LuxR C-terminal-related transcriptional regulator [Cognatishimia activa]